MTNETEMATPKQKQKPSKLVDDKVITAEEISDFPVVGIGASAGGLEALEQFFGNMPVDCGLAFVVIQHLDPTHAGIMPELLQRTTEMQVFQAADQQKVKKNCVYVIPPNKSLKILNRSLLLFDPVESRGLRLPIDIFFRSLADDIHEKSIAIVLSGMGSDGSLGIKSIKEKNGIVLVQDPYDAKFDGMPRSAIESVITDIVASAAELPNRLLKFLMYSPVLKSEQEIEVKNSSNLEKIILILREQTGQDFSLYKKNTLFRRIERRKGVHQIEKINNYVRFLQENPAEVEILFRELLIGVTSFFRDPAVWTYLSDVIFPELITECQDGYILRAWIPGCSTGEEAYSLAIVFREALEKSIVRKNITLQIFATDLDTDAIDKARKGYYSRNIANDVSPERLSRYFSLEAEGFRITPGIREMVVFAPHNAIKDPPFTKLDILSCRNLLIYLEQDLQKKLMLLFNYSLTPGGIMILGTAETIGNQSDMFKEVNSKLKIFRRTSSQITTDLIDFPSSFSRKGVTKIEKKSSQLSPDNIQVIADQVLLQRFAPASVLVNNKGDIIYMTGKIGKYLEPVAGKANWNIHAMAKDGLRQDLTSAFRKSLKSFEQVTLSQVKMGANGSKRLVDITIQQLDSPDQLKGFVFIVFTEATQVIVNEKTDTKYGKKINPGRVIELEQELQRTSEDLQTTREEMQTSQEELKSTNEELQSTNEELQSTNEELTTSKEEMQSLNEELQTLNVELQSKVSDFAQSNDDMKNLLNSTEIATLFIDRELNIRRFTDQVTNIFKLRITDIGRPFTEIVTNLQYPEIDIDARMVLKTLISKETAISSNDERWFNVRIMPYRTVDDRIDGLVITFSDITFAKKLESDLIAARAALGLKV